MRIGDSIRRSIRGLAQVTFVQACIGLYQAFASMPLTGEQIMAITIFATPLVTFSQNLLEDNTRLPAILKAPASEGVNPKPDPGDTSR